jgi:hypothetical protein
MKLSLFTWWKIIFLEGKRSAYNKEKPGNSGQAVFETKL